MIADRRDPIAFVNADTTAAPPGCVLEPVGTVDPLGRLNCRQPTAQSAGTCAVFVNDRSAVAAGSAGVCHSPYPYAIADAATADLPLTAGVPLGVVAGDWYLRTSASGFLAVGPAAYGSAPVIPTGGGGSTLSLFRVSSASSGSYGLVEVYCSAPGVTTDLAGGTVVDPGGDPAAVAWWPYPATGDTGYLYGPVVGDIVLASRSAVQSTDPSDPTRWTIWLVLTPKIAVVATDVACDDSGDLTVTTRKLCGPGLTFVDAGP